MGPLICLCPKLSRTLPCRTSTSMGSACSLRSELLSLEMAVNTAHGAHPWLLRLCQHHCLWSWDVRPCQWTGLHACTSGQPRCYQVGPQRVPRKKWGEYSSGAAQRRAEQVTVKGMRVRVSWISHSDEAYHEMMSAWWAGWPWWQLFWILHLQLYLRKGYFALCKCPLPYCPWAYGNT